MPPLENLGAYYRIALPVELKEDHPSVVADSLHANKPTPARIQAIAVTSRHSIGMRQPHSVRCASVDPEYSLERGYIKYVLASRQRYPIGPGDVKARRNKRVE
jgi:hypothetical protein